jgi:hypothetical protein
MVNGFIAHLYTRLGTTSNYSAIADLHTLQITRAHTKPSQSAVTSHFLVTDLNNGDSSASVVMPSLLSLPYRTFVSEGADPFTISRLLFFES